MNWENILDYIPMVFLAKPTNITEFHTATLDDAPTTKCRTLYVTRNCMLQPDDGKVR